MRLRQGVGTGWGGLTWRQAETEALWLRTAMSKSQMPCVRCGTNPRDVVGLPCMHLVACSQCMDGQRACVACGGALTGTIKCLLG
jgi:hypothetical protein